MDSCSCTHMLCVHAKHMCMYAFTDTLVCPCAHSAHMHTVVYVYTQKTHTCIHIQTHTQSCVYTYMDMHMHTHQAKHTHVHTCRCTQYAHIQTHTQQSSGGPPKAQLMTWLGQGSRPWTQPQAVPASPRHLSSELTMVLSLASSPLPTGEGGTSFCPKKFTHFQFFGLISLTNQIRVVLGAGDKDTVPIRPQEAPTSPRREIKEKTNLTRKNKHKHKNKNPPPGDVLF